MLNALAVSIYRWLCELLYVELAGLYDLISFGVGMGQWAKWRSVALDYVVGDAVLELGVGTGHLLPQLVRHVVMGNDTQSVPSPKPVVIGLERSTAMIDIARQRGGPEVGLIQAAAQQIPLADQSIQTIVCTFPAPYILDVHTLHECRRVLVCPDAENLPFGESRLVIAGLWVEPTGSHIQARLMRLVPFFYGRPTAQTIESIVAKIEDQGFQVTVHAPIVGSAQVGVLIAQPIPQPIAR